MNGPFPNVRIIGGRLTEYFGIKVVYGASLGLTAVGTLLSPVVARWHYTAFIALRIFQAKLNTFLILELSNLCCCPIRAFAKGRRFPLCTP